MKRPVFKIVDEARHESRLVVLTVLLELATEPEAELRSRIEAALRDQFRLVLIDLDQIQRMDSSGIGELIRAQAPLRDRGYDMHLCNVQERVQELLRATRLDTVFVVHESRDQALTALMRGATGE